MNDLVFKKAKNYIRHNHLYINEDENEVILLGYVLNMTNMEYAILRALAESCKKPLSLDEISKATGLYLTNSTLSYHVFRINEKAKAIGGRPLIKNIVKIGYFLNKEM